jgi:hypothetical protein
LVGTSFFSSCGLGLKKPRHDARFNPIKEQFVKDASYFGVDAKSVPIKIAFDNVKKRSRLFGFLKLNRKFPDTAEAFCAIWESKNKVLKPMMKGATGHYYGERYIIIDDRFREASLAYLESLVYHELGHCILRKEHEGTGIMSAENSPAVLGNRRYFYLKHFFQGHESEPDALRILREPSQDSELVYEASYNAFGESISHQLFWNEARDQFFVIDPN